MKNYFIFVLASLITNIATAALPEYEQPKILARANITDGYNLPEMSFLNNTSPVINNNGDVLFKVVAAEGINNQALWFKANAEENGKIIYVAPDERFITDPSINDSAKIAFNLYDEGVTDGLFVLDSKTLKIDQVLRPDNRPIQYYTYPQIKNNGHIFFRGTDDFNDRMFYEFTGKNKLNKIISEGITTLGIKSSYLFKPSVNESGAISFKSRMGDKGQWDESIPDSIILFTPSLDFKNSNSSFVTIAKDRDSDPTSPFLGFGNSTSISNNGSVAFVAIGLDSKKVVVLAHDNKLKTIAIEGSSGISEIETFAPKVNDLGMVLFRARDNEGKRALFLADENGIKRIIGEGDEISTDLGLGRILLNPNYPGFGGEIDMNDHGEIVFYCMIISASDSKELGSAVYKISPKI